MQLLPKKVIIEINKGIIEEWNQKNPDQEVFAADNNRLNEVMKLVKKQDDFITRAGYYMAAMAWAQPFSGANKRTGVVCADTWLRMNGYLLSAENDKDREYIRSLLFEVQGRRDKMDDFTVAKIILYVAKRLKKHGQ